MYNAKRKKVRRVGEKKRESVKTLQIHKAIIPI